MKKVLLMLAVLSSLSVVSCSPVEKQAYNVVVGSKAFLDAMKVKHPECSQGSTSNLCGYLAQATNAKDFVIDTLEIYCSGAQFETGGACNPPAKGTPAYQVATDKLKSALANYNQVEKDLRGVIR